MVVAGYAASRFCSEGAGRVCEVMVTIASITAALSWLSFVMLVKRATTQDVEISPDYAWVSNGDTISCAGSDADVGGSDDSDGDGDVVRGGDVR